MSSFLQLKRHRKGHLREINAKRERDSSNDKEENLNLNLNGENREGASQS